MSSPPNPLDNFSTYTYHFELFASSNYDDIAKVESLVSNVATSSTTASQVAGVSAPVLLINTRRDAHQMIDDVKFSYVGPSNNSQGFMVPDGLLTLKVFEPNRVYFLQKLQNLMRDHNVSNLSGLHWALKIYFVGRTPENKIGLLTGFESGVTIPIAFSELTSSFGPKGGEYNFTFVSQSSFACSADPQAQSFVMLAGYFNQNISIQAATVKEALRNLQTELNDKYKQMFQTELKSPNMRPIEYIINVHDSVLDGSIDLVGGESYAPNSKVPMGFSRDKTIINWIFDILRSSTELNGYIGQSIQNIRKPGHEGVNFFSVYPVYRAGERGLQIIYHVLMYKGQGKDKNVHTFDFMFGTDKHVNVDVLGFDMHMNSAQAWFSNTADSSTAGVTAIGGTPSSQKEAAKVYHEDRSQSSQNVQKGTSFLIPGGKANDIQYVPAVSKSDQNGQVKVISDKAAQNQKLMFNSIVQMHSAFDAQVAVTIRGNLNMLTAGIIKPYTTIGDLQKIPFGIAAPTWVKVNVKQRQGENQPSDFFYSGLYNLISIENHFVNGQFTQVLHVLMMGDEQDKKRFDEAAPSNDGKTNLINDNLDIEPNILQKNVDLRVEQQYLQNNAPKTS
jgi:hypothetical protein